MEKKEYIANQLKRTYGKKYENYCVTRIINKLDNLDIQFITQQMFKRERKEIALADLYFPQVNVWVEIDEHHYNQTEADKKRTEEVIKNNIKNKLKNLEEVIFLKLEEPERIIIYDEHTEITIEDINKRIDEIVELIKERIKMIGKSFVPWESVDKSPKYYIDKGYIEKKDNAKFHTLQLVSELFNKGYKGNQLAYFRAFKGNDIEWVWCPKLKLNIDDYKKISFDNEITEDGKYIYEAQKENNDQFLKLMVEKGKETRYVFPYFKDETGQESYKYFGIYEFDTKKSQEINKRVWVKVDDRLDLKQFFKLGEK